mmetsp:Transcript_51935/g.130485  ORF Transcript_51935/g.130485 Transcript_51935/m.130485 type:complete len:354 (+) Transcript_51935:91-1152(+)
MSARRPSGITEQSGSHLSSAGRRSSSTMLGSFGASTLISSKLSTNVTRTLFCSVSASMALPFAHSTSAWKHSGRASTWFCRISSMMAYSTSHNTSSCWSEGISSSSKASTHSDTVCVAHRSIMASFARRFRRAATSSGSSVWAPDGVVSDGCWCWCPSVTGTMLMCLGELSGLTPGEGPGDERTPSEEPTDTADMPRSRVLVCGEGVSLFSSPLSLSGCLFRRSRSLSRSRRLSLFSGPMVMTRREVTTPPPPTPPDDPCRPAEALGPRGGRGEVTERLSEVREVSSRPARTAGGLPLWATVCHSLPSLVVVVVLLGDSEGLGGGADASEGLPRRSVFVLLSLICPFSEANFL